MATLLERLEVRDNAALAFLRSDPRARPLVQLAPGRFLQANATADGDLNWLKVYLGGDADAMPGTTRILTVQRTGSGFQVSGSRRRARAAR